MVIFKNIDIDIDKESLENIDIDIDIDKEILVNIDIDIDKEVLENIDIEINIDKGIIKISIKEWIKMSAKYDIFCLFSAYFDLFSPSFVDEISNIYIDNR